jgi:hypothetical protein
MTGNFVNKDGRHLKDEPSLKSELISGKFDLCRPSLDQDVKCYFYRKCLVCDSRIRTNLKAKKRSLDVRQREARFRSEKCALDGESIDRGSDGTGEEDQE